MKNQDIKTDEIYQMLQTLEQVSSIAKASKFGLHTTYTKGLSDEEIANVFDGIYFMLEPMKSKLYDVYEERNALDVECEGGTDGNE